MQNLKFPEEFLKYTAILDSEYKLLTTLGFG